MLFDGLRILTITDMQTTQNIRQNFFNLFMGLTCSEVVVLLGIAAFKLYTSYQG